MAQNQLPSSDASSEPNSGTTTAVAPQTKPSLLSGVIRFFRKFSAGIWSLPELKKEITKALKVWESSCLLTDKAIERKNRAARKLEQFDQWYQALESEYKSRYDTALYLRRRKLENEANSAAFNLKALNDQELRGIKRLIKLKRLTTIFH